MHNNEASCLDLIDTLWNVKYSQFVDRSTGELDLIDTLWNVKRLGVPRFLAPFLI